MPVSTDVVTSCHVPVSTDIVTECYVPVSTDVVTVCQCLCMIWEPQQIVTKVMSLAVASQKIVT